jgi:arylsulfatase A
VPGIVRWPGKVEAGTVSDVPVSGVDFLPTACEIASITLPANRKLDGVSVVSLFAGKEVKRTGPLFWYFHRAQGANKVALRHGDWKILATLDQEPGRTNDITDEEERAFKAAKLDAFSLYNLTDDMGEKTDLAAAEPRKLAELKAMLAVLYDEVKAESPVWPAWKFTNAEGMRIVWPPYATPKKQKK